MPDTRVYFHLYKISRKVKTNAIAENSLVVSSGWEERLTAKGHERIFSCDRRVLKLDFSDVCTMI